VREWIDHDILFVKQLINGEGNFMSFEEFLTQFPGVRTNFVLYIGILNAIRSYSQKLNIIVNVSNTNTSNRYKLLDQKIWFTIKKGSKYIQTVFNNNKAIPAAITKWNHLFDNLNWKLIFSHCFKTTADVQLRWFQTRLLHRLLPTQRYLFLQKIVDSPTCNFCNQEEQTIPHMLHDCVVIQKFWTDLENMLKDKCQHCYNMGFSKELILFGVRLNTRTDKVMDLLLLLAKFYIYKCKLQDVYPNLQAFVAVLKNRFCIEKYLSVLNYTATKFEENWFPYFPVIS
jgi:hypothetical protein